MNITVVGAGVIGCAVARELASRGARVQLIDPRGAGRGATYASAGILAPHIESQSSSFLRLASCSLSMWDEFIQRLHVDSGQRVDYDRSGTLQVALDSTQAAALEAMAQSLKSSHVACSLLDAREARQLEPALTSSSMTALLLPSHGYVASPLLVAALIEVLSRTGVPLTATRVVHLHDGDHDAEVMTEGGAIRSDAVVIAAGSWSTELFGTSAPRAIKPIRGQLVRLTLDQRPASRVVWSDDCYVVPWRDGTVLVGATVEDVGFAEHTTADGVQRLLKAAAELMPLLREARFEDARAGLRPKTADELPAIGRSSTMPHVFYAAGHYRNGVLLAPLTAALVADLVLEGRERPELALVRPDRFGL